MTASGVPGLGTRAFVISSSCSALLISVAKPASENCAPAFPMRSRQTLATAPRCTSTSVTEAAMLVPDRDGAQVFLTAVGVAMATRSDADSAGDFRKTGSRDCKIVA